MDMEKAFVAFDNKELTIMGVFTSEEQARNAIVEFVLDDDNVEAQEVIGEYRDYLNDFVDLTVVHPSWKPQDFTSWFFEEREDTVVYSNGAQNRFSITHHFIDELDAGVEV